MNKLADFIKSNKSLCYAMAEENTLYNGENKAVIAKNDEWIEETEWDEYYKELVKK